MPTRSRTTHEASGHDLKAVRAQLISHWAAMSPYWAVSRSIARVYAYLLTSASPPHADEIAAGLGISRGNVSMAVRDLMRWGVIHKGQHTLDRKEYYEIEPDMGRTLLGVIKERQRREYEPTLRVLKETLASLKTHTPRQPWLEQRLKTMETFYERVISKTDQFIGVGTLFMKKKS